MEWVQRVEGLERDLRYGIRTLIRTPLLSATAVVTLGLGVGATTFAYSITYAFTALPVAKADRLMVVRRTAASGREPVPFQDYRDFRDRQTVFRDLAAGYSSTMNLAGDDRAPERVQGGHVTANAFDGLGILPVLGRSFQEGDDAPGAPALLLLGFDVWRNRYAGDSDVIGRAVRVNGEPATVVGVMPDGFGFPIADDVWIPLRYDPDTLTREAGAGLSVWGYLREGATQGAATTEFQGIARQLEAEFPEQNEGAGAQVLPFVDGLLPNELYGLARVLMVMVLGVLLVACANVANLLLARALVRQRDAAIRSALGAPRSRVIRQMLTEALVIAVLGGVAGLAFVQLAFPWYEGLVGGIPRPYWFVFSLKSSALVFTMGVTIAAALLAGTLPAIRASGVAVGSLLRDEGRSSSSLRVGRFTRGLVVVELAVSFALLIGAGLARRSVMDVDRFDLGFDVARVTTARIGVLDRDYPDPVARNQFYHELLGEVRSDPGVTAVALTNLLPGTDQFLWSFRVEGASYPLLTDIPEAGGVTVSAGYFDTFGMQVVEGRDFLPSESLRNGEPVVIVNRAFAERYLGGSDALGRRVRLGTEELGSAPWMRVVGVVSDSYQGMRVFSDQEPRPEAIFQPLGLADPPFMSVAARTRGAPEAFMPRLLEATARVDPNLPLYGVRSMRLALEESQFVNRGMGILFTVVSVVGLFLAVVGLYGVMDFSVSTRLRELGIRIALGANRRNVLGIVFSRVFLQVALGSALGLALGFALGTALSAVLPGVESWNTAVSITVIIILGLTCTAGALLPALNALRADPVEALRAE